MYFCGIKSSSMDITIGIKKADIYEEVTKTTSYMGAKSDADGAYDKVRTVDGDGDMLDRFWDEACSALTAVMKEFVTAISKQVSAANDGINYTLTLPANWDGIVDDGKSEELTNDSSSYLVNYIVGKWLQFIQREEAEKYLTEASGLLLVINKAIYRRKRPVRTTPV